MSSPAAPLTTPREIREARRLIEAQGLSFESDYDDLAGSYEAGALVATGARAGEVLKMLAIDPAHQSGDLLGALVTELMRLGRAAERDVFWVFTPPGNAPTFERPVALLEYGGGLAQYLAAHAGLRRPGRNGAVVANANPFTLGHLFLVETAAREVDTLYLFIVREDRSVFPFDVRYRLAEESTRHLPNVAVLDTSRYAVSGSTFPSYFLKRHDDVARSQMQIDVRLFASHLAPAFFVTRRFVGHEPYCATTAAYNSVMAEALPEYGMALVEVRRAAGSDGFISATMVRDAVAKRDFEAIGRMVPPPTLAFLRSQAGGAVAERLAVERATR
jgi:[citrate (pro-3S)-lyase] ligase